MFYAPQKGKDCFRLWLVDSLAAKVRNQRADCVFIEKLLSGPTPLKPMLLLEAQLHIVVIVLFYY